MHRGAAAQRRTGAPNEGSHRGGKGRGRGASISRAVVAHLRVAVEGAREAKVADLERAVGIDEQVGGVQVAVEDVRGVGVREAREELQERVGGGRGGGVRGGAGGWKAA